MKKIGFLSFGHWSEAPGSQVRSGSDSLLQSIELAVAAEEAGADGAYFRVHHYARQLGSPFPLLAAVGAELFGGDRKLDRLQQSVGRGSGLGLGRGGPMAEGEEADFFHCGLNVRAARRITMTHV